MDVPATNATITIHRSRPQLAAALAEAVAGALARAIADNGRASLAVSGGNTPGAFFDALSAAAIDWSRVDVTLVDERFVPESSERSNARLVRQRLLVNDAAAARFHPLYRPLHLAEAAAFQADGELYPLVRRLDVVVLGMGGDGHVASYFPDAESYEKLYLACDAVMAVRSVSAGEPRLTVSPRLVANAGSLFLHIEGAEKKAVLDAALAEAGPNRLPVATVIALAKAPVAIHWAE